MAFKPGAEWRGNASGRPKKTEAQINFERRCREWAELFALDKLKKAADSDKPGEIIAAVKEICDRGFGKAEAISYIEANVTDITGTPLAALEGELDELVPGEASKGIGHDSPPALDGGK